MPALLDQLAAVTAAHPHAHKLLIGPSIAWGRELLATLANQHGGWIGWRAVTLDILADELTYTARARQRVRRVGALEQRLLLEAALAAAESALTLPDDVRGALTRAGARRAIGDTVLELRDGDADRVGTDGWPMGTLLDRTRDEYAAALRGRSLIDGADVLHGALTADAAAWAWFADTPIVLGDLAPLRGLRGALRDALQLRGAITLSDDRRWPTHLTAFAAATPADELREVLRRALDLGVRLDEIEIVSTDDDSYGLALDDVCTQLGLDASMSRGVPFAATRVGRQVVEWLDTLPLPEPQSSPRLLAGELLLRLDAMPGPLDPIDERHRVRCADELRSVMTALDQPMPADAALAMVREVVLALRGLARASGVERPRYAGGVVRDGTVIGRLHLTSLGSAGLTGRRLCAIVGLDAERTRGPMIQSAVLPDARRERLGGALPTTTERRRARGELVVQAITRAAAMSEQVLLSFSTASATSGRDAGPSQFLLDAVRRTDPTVRDHELLRSRLGAPVGAAPRADRIALDGRDVWLRALTRDALLLDGSALLAGTVTGLTAGLARVAADADPTAAAWHGLVPAARGVVDPRRTGEAISASSLERLGSCALRWFYKDVLRLASPPPPPDPDVWLDAAQRGEVLHRIYAKVVRRRLLVDRTRSRADVEAEAVAIAAAVLDAFALEAPPPSPYAATDAQAAIADEVRHFVRYEWAMPPVHTVATERRFGGEGPVIVFPLPDGQSLRLRGTIDRADRLDDGTVRIIDYKTGSAASTAAGEAPLGGGRRLQLPLYAAAAEQLFEASVSRAELWHPTVRGGGEVVAMDAADRTLAPPVVASLLDAVAEGAFLPTDDASDCGWCEFAAICRVRVDRFGAVESPRAEWAAAAVESAVPPATLVAQRARRGRSE